MASAASPGAGQHHQPVSRRGEGHVPLDPVEPEAGTVGLGPDLDAARRVAVLGLQPGRGEDGLARGQARSHWSFCAVAAGGGQDPAPQDGADEMGDRGQRPPELLVEGHALDQGHARAAVLLGQQQADEVELAQLRPQRGRVADGVVLHVAHHVERAVAGQHVARRLAQHLLFLDEIKVQHVSTSFAIDRGAVRAWLMW